MKKLVSVEKVFALLGGACSNSTLAVWPEIEKSDVPFILNSATSDAITDPVIKNIYTSQVTATVESKAQLDYALRLDPQLFTWAAVDDDRIREFPKPSALVAKRMVMDATYPLEDGAIYSKYFYSAAMDENHRVHGAMGDGLGAWVIMPLVGMRPWVGRNP